MYTFPRQTRHSIRSNIATRSLAITPATKLHLPECSSRRHEVRDVMQEGREREKCHFQCQHALR